MVWGRHMDCQTCRRGILIISPHMCSFPHSYGSVEKNRTPSSRLPEKRLRPWCASRPCCCSLRLAQPTWRPALRRPPVPRRLATWCSSSSSCWRRRRTAERERCWRADLVSWMQRFDGDFATKVISWGNLLAKSIGKLHLFELVWT